MFRLLLLVGLLNPFALRAETPSSNVLNAVILGSGSPQFDPNRSGPSVLLRMGETEVLVDIGNGTQAQLERLGIPIRNLDGLLFTHHHLDHNEEFIPVFIRALLGNNRFMLAGPAPMHKMADTTLEIYKEDIEYRMRRSGRLLADVIPNATVKELTGGETFTLGGIRVSTAKVNHTIATTAFRFDAGGRSIVVSGDLIYSPTLSALAKGADYLIIDSGGTIKVDQGIGSRQSRSAQSESTQEAQSRRGQRRRTPQGNTSTNGAPGRAHVTLQETARMASEAKVKAIVLTHFTPGEIDEQATIAALRKAYSGKILFASDLMVIGGTL